MENSAYSYLYAFVGGGNSEACARLAVAKSRAEFEGLARKLTASPCSNMQNVSGSKLGTASAKDVSWLTASGRRAGDTFIGQNRDVLYFLSVRDNGYGNGTGSWLSLAKTGLRGETFSTWENGVLSKCGVTVLGGMKYARSLT